MAVDENRALLGLLNGIARIDYYNDKEITTDFLKSELYPQVPESDFELVLKKARGLVKNMASTKMDLNQAEMFLTSQSKKKDSGLSQVQVQVYLKFWKTHQQRIFDHLVDRCMWSSRLKNFSWRIDVESRSRHADQLNVPTAIVEMQIGKNNDDQVVQFEMDESQMGSILGQLKDIEELIATHGGLES